MHAKRFAIPVLMAAAFALSACSDPAAYHMGEAERQAMPPPPVAPIHRVADADFCCGVAHKDTGGYFDAQTQARLYNANYRQCMTVFGPPALRLAALGGGDAGY